MSKRPSILVVLYYYHPYVSGLTICAKRLAEAWAAAGHEVTVLATRHDASLPAREVINGVTVVRKPVLFSLGKGVVSPAFLLAMAVMARRFDVVNFHLPLADAGLSSLFIPRRKLVTTYQCDINLGAGIVSRVVEGVSYFLMGILLRRSRAIVPSSLDYFSHSRFRGLGSKAVEIAPGVPTALFKKTTGGPALRKKLGLGEDEYLIGFVGRIVYEKGLQYLLQTIPLLEGTLDRYRIVIAGDYRKVAGGSVKEELDAYLGSHPHRVLFTGFLTDAELRDFYSTIDVLVLPSIDPLEAFGMVQVEAMCAGVPVIASDLPGVRTIVQRTGFGRVTKRKDAEDLAKKILDVRKSPPSSKGFDPSEWDTERSAQLYLDLFSQSLT